MLFIHNTDIGRAFGVKLITSSDMDNALQLWDSVSTGTPPWQNSEDEIYTVNMAKHISDTRARLTTMGLDITISGSRRAEYLQDAADELLKRLPDRIADADRLGGMIIKYNGEAWDFVLPGSFGIAEQDSSGNITGAIFAAQTTQGDTHYTRLEYHRFEGKTDAQRVYRITNKVFRNSLGAAGNLLLGSEVSLQSVDQWAHMAPDVKIRNVDKPLFGVYRVPGSNTVDPESPLGLSIFSNALTELKAIDVAISRKNSEVEDSKHITFVGQTLIRSAEVNKIPLPRFVRGLGMGLNDSETSAIHEHVPTMLTEARIRDINFNLSMAGMKCGFSEGVFVMDGQRGVITATQVEADDRDTIQTIKADRDALQTAIEQAIQGADVLATLGDRAPLGDYDINFNFGDITYNYAEDQQRWMGYVMQGWIPPWKYLVKFEGMSEEEAKAMVQEVQQAATQQAMLFGAE